jgi:hypothetical protein
MRESVCRATAIDEYDADPADATPSTASLNPTTIRFFTGRRRDAGFCVPSRADRDDVREKLAPNGKPPAGVMVPLIVAPLFATNETDAPVASCVLVAVTTCTPAAGDSVHVTVAFPSLSVVLVLADKVPPPATVHAIGTPETALFTPSSAWMTSGCERAVETSPD